MWGSHVPSAQAIALATTFAAKSVQLCGVGASMNFGACQSGDLLAKAPSVATREDERAIKRMPLLVRAALLSAYVAGEGDKTPRPTTAVRLLTEISMILASATALTKTAPVTPMRAATPAPYRRCLSH